MQTADFDYHLPPGLIAQHPLEPRDSSRLMVLRRDGGSLEHRRFTDLPGYLREGDVLVFNDSRVIPARLRGQGAGGGSVELLLLRRCGDGDWEALVKPGKRLRAGSKVNIINRQGSPAAVSAEVLGSGEGGIRTVRFSGEAALDELGEVPLPPYIRTPLADPQRYQTVYAREPGSAAAPTAGLHFTPRLMGELERRGVSCQFVTLHVGLDTFRPVRVEDPRRHAIYREYGVLSQAVAAELSRAKQEGRRIICVGTTAVRLVEQAAQASAPGQVEPFAGWVSLFILPGYRFRLLDALVSNFHLPRSTLLMLVSAFAGRELILQSYQEAIRQGYRFYSFGDAMLVI